MNTLSAELNALPLSWDKSGTYGLRPGFALEVNDWNCKDVPHTLTAHADREYSKIGFQWDIPEPTGEVMMYPEVIGYGRKPWVEFSLFNSLLKSLSEHTKVETEFAYRIEASGKYNVALQSWLLSSADAGPEGIVAEIMYWLEASGGAVPAGRQYLQALGMHANYTDKFGQSWDVWQDAPTSSRPWPYYAFVANGVAAGQVDVLGSLGMLRTLDTMPLEGDPYLATVEIGTEVFSGTGSIIYDLFNVEVE